jgi:hypothetical protein
MHGYFSIKMLCNSLVPSSLSGKELHSLEGLSLGREEAVMSVLSNQLLYSYLLRPRRESSSLPTQTEASN